MLTVGINRAVMLIAEKDVWESRARGPKRVLRKLGPIPPTARRCGSRPGITARSSPTGAAMPRCRRRFPPDDLTLEQALALLDPQER